MRKFRMFYILPDREFDDLSSRHFALGKSAISDGEIAQLIWTIDTMRILLKQKRDRAYVRFARKLRYYLTSKLNVVKND